MKRIATAFLVAPLVPVTLFIILVSLLGLAFGGVSILPAVTYAAPIWLFFALPVSYAVTTVFGIPAFMLFRHFGWLSVHSLTLGASVVGLIVGIVIGTLFSSSQPFGCVAAALIFAAFGAASGYAFWYLAYRSA